MDRESLKNLFLKYHRPGARYTFYPPLNLWSDQGEQNDFVEHLKFNYNQEKGIDLYVHIPFCQSLCTFCGCNIKVTKDHSVELPYLETLLLELDHYLETIPELKIYNLYLGGGTPTFLSPSHLDKLLQGIFSRVERGPHYTASIETDPRHLSKEHLEVLSHYNFNRIILGIQDTNENILANVNRYQTLEQVYQAVELAREHDFKEVLFELIYGLPFQTDESLKETIGQLMECRPESFILYPLALVPWQREAQKAYGDFSLPSNQEKYEMLTTIHQELEHLGNRHIGMGHYCSPNSPLLKSYEQKKMGRTLMGLLPGRSNQLIGLGVSAISSSSDSIIQNNRILTNYEHTVRKGEFIPQRFHHQTPLERTLQNLLERIICQGEADLAPYFRLIENPELVEGMKKGLSELEQDQLITLSGENIQVTQMGRLFLKNICFRLDYYLVRDSLE